jgi:hypothetical protein
MKFTTIALIIALLQVTSIACEDHGVIHDKESFLKVYNSDKLTKDMKFVKKYYPTEDKVLDRVEYIEFLAAYLDSHIDDLPDDEDIREEAELHHKEQAESYLNLQGEKDKEDFTISEVVRDIGIGNLMVYVGNGGNEYAGDEDYDQETMDFLSNLDQEEG